MRHHALLLALAAMNLAASASAADPVPVLQKPAAPIDVEGTPADQLSDPQLRAFLGQKLLHLDQSSDTVELIRVAPGYAASLVFDRPLEAIVVGDPSLVAYKQHDRMLVLSAAQRSGDTSLRVMFRGGVLLNYHIFIAPDYRTAVSTVWIRVAGSGSDGSGRTAQPMPLREVLANVWNFDARKSEGAIGNVQRVPIFRRAEDGVELYDVFRFKDGTNALTFGMRGSDRPLPSHLRLRIGETEFRPAYASLEAGGPSGESRGMLIFRNPPFDWDQPFRIVCE